MSVTTACWPVDWSCADNAYVDRLDPGVRGRAEALAVGTLRSLTAYQVGGCPVTVRPCAKGCAAPLYYEAPVTGAAADALGAAVGPWWASVGVDGQWVNTSCGCTTDCSCTTVSEVVLTGPVGAVGQVVIDGTVLDPSTYRVDNGNRLVRLDGAWPRCQDMSAAADAQGAFAVTYTPGWPVDDTAAWVAGKLAVEFAQACTGGKCRLPNGVRQVTRQGVSMDIPASMFAGGITGITEVDAWVRIWNPNALTLPSQVWSPDLRPPRRTTWSAT